jgi:hypothetical protein
MGNGHVLLKLDFKSLGISETSMAELGLQGVTRVTFCGVAIAATLKTRGGLPPRWEIFE